MINKSLNEITEQDLQDLIDNKVIETKTIEYKKELPDSRSDSKKEFLRDVTSMANSQGGDLIFGISEDDEGYPEDLVGLEVDSLDEEIRRLESIVNTGVEPIIGGINTRFILLSSGKKIIIMRILKSWNRPHRVSLGGDYRFYIRDTNSRHIMDVGELKVAFNLSETFTDRIRKFREERISKLFIGEVPITVINKEYSIDNPYKLTLHLIPFNAFEPGQNYFYDIYNLSVEFRPIGSSGWNSTFNFDGYLTYAIYNDSYSYVQFFRNGIVEAVYAGAPEKKELGLPYHENRIVGSLEEYMKSLKGLEVNLPIFIFLTFVGVKGYKVVFSGMQAYNLSGYHEIDRAILLLPELIIDNYALDIDTIMKPVFDVLWNACGLPKSVSYDEEGKRKKEFSY